MENVYRIKYVIYITRAFQLATVRQQLLSQHSTNHILPWQDKWEVYICLKKHGKTFIDLIKQIGANVKQTPI